MTPRRKDPPILAFMVAETVIWAAIFYSFPALVLNWQAEFGWTTSQVMGAFSLAILIQGLAAPWAGRALDAGRAPWAFGLGGIGGAVGLLALSVVESLWAFYAIWAWMGGAMALTLYDACFTLVTRARGTQARRGITAITLAAGFASTLAYPLAAWISTAEGWRVAVLVFAGLVLVVNVPLAVFAARRLEAEVTQAETIAPATQGLPLRPSGLPGFWSLAVAFALAGLGTGIVMSHLLPMMAALGVTGAMAVAAASMIGPSQVAGRVVLMTVAARVAALPLTRFAMMAMAVALLVLSVATLVPQAVFAFAVIQGVGYGMVSIVRPVLIRDVLGQTQFGRNAGAVAQYALFAFALAPGLGAVVADVAGYGWVIGLCVLSYGGALACLLRLPAAR